MTRFEHATSASQTQHSTKLSYIPKKNGASCRIRTNDLLITNELHYHCAKLAKNGSEGRGRTYDLEVNSFPLVPLSYFGVKIKFYLLISNHVLFLHDNLRKLKYIFRLLFSFFPSFYKSHFQTMHILF